MTRSTVTADHVGIMDGSLLGIPRYESITRLSDLPCFARGAAMRDQMEHDARRHNRQLAGRPAGYGYERFSVRRALTRLWRVVERIHTHTGRQVIVRAGGVSRRPKSYVPAVVASGGCVSCIVTVGRLEFTLSTTLSVRGHVEALVGDPWSDGNDGEPRDHVVTYRVHQVPALIRYAVRRWRDLREAKVNHRRAKAMECPHAAAIVAILGADDLGSGYMIHPRGIETAHDWSLNHPDWRESVGSQFLFGESTLSLNSTFDRLIPKIAKPAATR